MNATLPRSYLFVPGNRADRFDKARAAGADAVIVDLEDAVQPAEKTAARDAVFAYVDAKGKDAGTDASKPLWIRVNSTDTEWFEDDVRALAAHRSVAGIMLPKAESDGQIDAVLAHAHAGLQVLPLVETARGIAGLAAICGARRVARIAFGTIDFQVDLGIDGDAEELDAFRSQLVLASRLASIGAPVDGVTTALDDAPALEREARRSRRFGFGAKLCIHPKQVEPVHRAYAWSDEERAWAQRVLDAVEKSAGAAVAVDGKMVDLPVILRARRVLGVG